VRRKRIDADNVAKAVLDALRLRVEKVDARRERVTVAAGPCVAGDGDALARLRARIDGAA
jgi:Holliday junction resolvase RusA-like endonuclease